MSGGLREYSGSLFLSLLLHGMIAAAFILAALMHFSTDAPHAGLASPPIDAVLVDSRVLHAADEARAAAAAQARAAAEAKVAEEARAAQAAAARGEAPSSSKLPLPAPVGA